MKVIFLIEGFYDLMIWGGYLTRPHGEGIKAQTKSGYLAAIQALLRGHSWTPSNHVYRSNRSAFLETIGQLAKAKADGKLALAFSR